MAIMDDVKQFRAEADKSRDEAFARWIGGPAVRVALSIIPASEHADALRMLLQDAFNTGCLMGEGITMGMMLKKLMERQKP